LLKGLAGDNSKAWMDEHREEVKAKLREPFADLLEQLSGMLKGNRPPLSGGAGTMFRMHRDVRFSSDKRPYNEHVSGLLTPSGEKSEGEPLLYLHLDAEGGFAGAGCYKLPTAELNQIRELIVADPERFADVRADLADAGLEFSDEEAVKTMPRGFAQHADSPHVEILRLKSLLVRRDLPKTAWKDGSIAERVAEFARNASPLLRFCADGLSN
ncbi:MAG: DUF2461 domain-containing protein, partial [Planctomycetota bacterium]